MPGQASPAKYSKVKATLKKGNLENECRKVNHGNLMCYLIIGIGDLVLLCAYIPLPCRAFEKYKS